MHSKSTSSLKSKQYGTHAGTLTFEEDFNRALATALTQEEFLADIYDFIDSLPWKERQFFRMALKNFSFDRYGSDMQYITYKANKTTSWYIFYQQQDNVFLIRHITNNHVAAQYFS